MTPPFVTFALAGACVVMAALWILSAVWSWRLRSYQQQILSNERRILADLRQLRELLTQQDQTITEHVNEGMRRLERELHAHMGSNLLHAGAPPDAP